MSTSLKQLGLRAISGRDRSIPARILQVILTAAEPIYASAMRVRNFLYDTGYFRSHSLKRWTISVGNITTGGTGKTPVVHWLGTQLRQRGHSPAVLLRGYGATALNGSDEASLLDQTLNGGDQTTIPVHANPSRVDGAANVLRSWPQTDCFILDDAFQHRKAQRDFNLVIISATQPFGFGHVLPRGLLREPLSGLIRADAFLVTRCSLVSDDILAEIDRALSQWNLAAPVFRCNHQHSGIRIPARDETMPMTALLGRKVYLTAGIGDPTSFENQITTAGGVVVGSLWFDDHYAFTSADIEHVVRVANGLNADFILTTEKDWVKISRQSIVHRTIPPIAVVKMQISFKRNDGSELFDLIVRSME